MIRRPALLSCALLVACVPPPPTPDESKCNHTLLEPDFEPDGPLTGPGVTANGKLPKGRYVYSSTYLAIQLSTDAFSRFSEVSDPVSEALSSQPGLVAYQTGFSRDCYAARTIAVWKDEESMANFVGGPAHGAAIQAIDQISRGKSIVTHWEDDETAAIWKRAVEMITLDEGPYY
jgi:quinol monooxygenase YgiN